MSLDEYVGHCVWRFQGSTLDISSKHRRWPAGRRVLANTESVQWAQLTDRRCIWSLALSGHGFGVMGAVQIFKTIIFFQPITLSSIFQHVTIHNLYCTDMLRHTLWNSNVLYHKSWHFPCRTNIRQYGCIVESGIRCGEGPAPAYDILTLNSVFRECKMRIQ